MFFLTSAIQKKEFRKLFVGLPTAVKLVPVLIGVLLVGAYGVWVDSPRTTDAFLQGEYYFNSFNVQNGEYDLKLARQYYTKAIEEGSDNPLVWYQLGRIDFLEGNYSAALYKFDKQINLHGDIKPNVYYMRGLTYGYKARKSGGA